MFGGKWCSRGVVLGAMLSVLFGLCTTAVAQQSQKEKQSILKTAKNERIPSSKLMNLLNDKLQGAYQDLELVFKVCYSGENTTRAAGEHGLLGEWSVSTSCDTKATGKNAKSDSDESTFYGKEGLLIGDTHYHGYAAQYIKKLLEGKNTVSNRQLHDYAKANHFLPEDRPQYLSSGATADDMTVHGGNQSNHAIIFSTPAGLGEPLTDKLYEALEGAGYQDDDITFLRGLGEPEGHVDGKARLEDLDTALDDLKAALDAHPGEEKAYIFFDCHGVYHTKNVVYQEGKFSQPGGGVVVTHSASSVEVYTDDDTLVSGLKEELPKFYGGVWQDDPFLHRVDPPELLFSTFEESFTTPDANVEVYLDGFPIGLVEMGNATGSDYAMEIPDFALNALMNRIESEDTLDVDFYFPDENDFFQLAVTEDFYSPGYTHSNYGIGLAITLDSAFTVPEPGSLALLIVAGLTLIARRLPKVRGDESAR